MRGKKLRSHNYSKDVKKTTKDEALILLKKETNHSLEADTSTVSAYCSPASFRALTTI